MEVRCRVANERGHALSLKSLTPVHFTLDQGGEKKQKVCPTCSKQLSKHTKLAVMRSCCGTVLCDRCCGQLVERPLKSALALKEKGEKNGAGSDDKSNLDSGSHARALFQFLRLPGPRCRTFHGPLGLAWLTHSQLRSFARSSSLVCPVLPR